MGAWIETCGIEYRCSYKLVAPLWERGLKPNIHVAIMEDVAGRSLMGAWIETDLYIADRGLLPVAPLWERGLKLQFSDNDKPSGHVAPLWERGLKLINPSSR